MRTATAIMLEQQGCICQGVREFDLFSKMSDPPFLIFINLFMGSILTPPVDLPDANSSDSV